MMIGKFLAVAILVVPIFADTDIPLKQLYQIVKYYPRVSFCNRDIVSGYWMAAGNVRHITYTGNLKPGENARELCHCMNEHMTQNDWCDGARRVCYYQCDKVTYSLTGKPDPTYDPNAKDDVNFDRPLEKLQVILKNTPKTDPVGLKCDASCFEESDIIYCSLQCPLANETRTNDKVCADLENYYNQNDWLVGATLTCDVEDNVVRAYFIGSADDES